MKTCPFCAEHIQDAAIVCKHCGRDLGIFAGPAPPIFRPEPKPAAKAGRIRWGCLIPALVVIALGAYCVSLVVRSSPDRQAQRPRIQQGERSGAYRDHKFSARVEATQAAVIITPPLKINSERDLHHALNSIVAEVFGVDTADGRWTPDDRWLRQRADGWTFEVLIIKDESMGIQGLGINYR